MYSLLAVSYFSVIMQDALSVHIIVHFLWNCVVVVVVVGDELQSQSLPALV